MDGQPALLAVHRVARHVQDTVEIPEPIEGEGQILAGLVVDLELAHRDTLAMHRRIEPTERLEREQPQNVARAGETARAESRPAPFEPHRAGQRHEARREVRDDRGAGRGDALPAVRVLLDDHSTQQLHRRRRGNRKPSVRCIDPAPANRKRPARPRGVETLDQPGRAHDVRDRIVRPDLVKAHVVDGHSVHRRLRRREPGEDVQRPGPHVGVEIGFIEQSADVAVEMMVAGGPVPVTMIVRMHIGMAGRVSIAGGSMLPAVIRVGMACLMIAAGISSAGGSVFMIIFTAMRMYMSAAGITLEDGIAVMVGTGGRPPAMVRSIASMRVGLAVPAGCLVHREPRSGQCMIGVIDTLDGGDRVEPGAFKGRDE